MSTDMLSTVDITPTPRILRVLGDIPFDAWQCIAELMDNSFDAFASAKADGIVISSPKVSISWSKNSVAPEKAEFYFEDNGPGMTLETLQKAARAGYSSNDPIHNLGLFGMGFNIATARLGDETTFLSATCDSDDWVGIRISFSELLEAKSFQAPVVRIPKKEPGECGTKIIVRKLREGSWNDLRTREKTIRNRLEAVYSPILNRKEVKVFLQATTLSARRHCVWDDSRYVVYKKQQINAIQRFDQDLGEGLFDQGRNCYISEESYLQMTEDERAFVVKRPRRLHGWVGIQRFSHPQLFGIDFIRNGRKILSADRKLFDYENEDTGAQVTEYPIELSSTIGGRIVGEVHVDYLIPNYQKTGFDQTDGAWQMTRLFLRGEGPLLPAARKALNLDENTSPVSLLVNAYRRSDPGVKCLAMRNQMAKDYYQKFLKGDPDYESDLLWFKAVQAVDQAKADGGDHPDVGINPGSAPSDDPDQYGPETGPDVTPPLVATASENKLTQPEVVLTSVRDDLIKRAVKDINLSGKYEWTSDRTGIEVSVWTLTKGVIKKDGERVPTMMTDTGIEVDFFVDPTHPVISEYPFTPKQLLLVTLAERYHARDRDSVSKIFNSLVVKCMDEDRINFELLRDRSAQLIESIKDQLPDLLEGRFLQAKTVIGEDASVSQQFYKHLLLEDSALLNIYSDGANEDVALQAFSKIPPTALPMLIRAIPEAFFDGKIFKTPYLTLSIPDEDTVKMLRSEAVKMVSAYVEDLLSLLTSLNKPRKTELMRYANTLSILEGLR